MVLRVKMIDDTYELRFSYPVIQSTLNIQIKEKEQK